MYSNKGWIWLWYTLKYPEVFENIDKSKCSHWFEWDDARFFSEEELEKIKKLGFNDFISKPIQKQKLFELIKVYMNR